MIFTIFFLLALTIEGVLTTIPLTFIVLLTYLIIKRQIYIFYLAFIAGIILDLLSIRTLGISSVYFLIFFLAVFFYERKFEIQTIIFVILASFFGSLGFLLITSFSNIIILQAIVATLIGLSIYKLLNYAPSARAQGMVN